MDVGLVENPEIKDSQPIKNETSYTIEQLSVRGFLRRNQRCLCGSGKKLKYCCKDLLKIRPKKVQERMDFEIAYNHHNENNIKAGFKKMSKDQFKEYLQSKNDI